MKFNYDNGKLIESFSEVKLGEDMIKDAELFAVGIHRGQKYEVADLQRLSDNFNAEEQVPIQLDHSESARDTVGFLESVRVVGNKLLGTVRIIDEFAKERIAKKLMKKLSISFYTDSTGKPQKLREVSLVAFPQVKSAQLFKEQSSLADLQRKADVLQREANLMMQYSETRLLAQQLELGIKQLTREFSKREAPKKLTEEERTKKAQEEFEQFYENYEKIMNW
ncbi:hypothetical protein BACCIP111899_04150 [Bacillus rhizoplanae]|uniref:Phage prohead protease, HK97 family n=1 Tax=Bacillus rhizoplanae TaxID=2880966 RepID=A0ABN8A1C5_9BACI|nr:hypothetical protein [Bacillus rhizoplanae]CAG9614917.1 hypothetical protein BACCIP111899_04150 [Bacillus rhizoplanae]